MTEAICGFVELTSRGKRRLIRADRIDCIEDPGASGRVYVWCGIGRTIVVDESCDEVLSRIRAASASQGGVSK